MEGKGLRMLENMKKRLQSVETWRNERCQPVAICIAENDPRRAGTCNIIPSRSSSIETFVGFFWHRRAKSIPSELKHSLT